MTCFLWFPTLLGERNCNDELCLDFEVLSKSAVKSQRKSLINARRKAFPPKHAEVTECRRKKL